MCYTSGTTGDPKGVVYSHRSTYLYAMAVLAAGVKGITEADRALAIVPMFHANAWGLPYAAFLSGATLHMPDRFLQPEHLTQFIAAERSTVTSGVPTIWNSILDYGQAPQCHDQGPAPVAADKLRKQQEAAGPSAPAEPSAPGLACWPELLMDEGQAAVDVTICAPASEMSGYLSRPGGDSRWPGVVVLHDGFGPRGREPLAPDQAAWAVAAGRHRGRQLRIPRQPDRASWGPGTGLIRLMTFVTPKSGISALHGQRAGAPVSWRGQC